MEDQKGTRPGVYMPLFVWFACAYFAWRVSSGGIAYLPHWTTWVFLVVSAIAAFVFFRNLERRRS